MSACGHVPDPHQHRQLLACANLEAFGTRVLRLKLPRAAWVVVAGGYRLPADAHRRAQLPAARAGLAGGLVVLVVVRAAAAPRT